MAFIEIAGGAVLGFVLTTLGGAIARRDERRHQRREKVRDRELGAVAVLDDALREAQWRMPVFAGTEEAEQSVFRAHDAWQDGWFRAGGLVRDPELLDRYLAAGWALLSALLDEQHGRSANDWIVGRAIHNARAGCAAFLRDEALPSPTFPTRTEARQLAPVGPDGPDYSKLDEWLQAHPDLADSL